jgi:hypothetical protein
MRTDSTLQYVCNSPRAFIFPCLLPAASLGEDHSFLDMPKISDLNSSHLEPIRSSIKIFTSVFSLPAPFGSICHSFLKIEYLVPQVRATRSSISSASLHPHRWKNNAIFNPSPPYLGVKILVPRSFRGNERFIEQFIIFMPGKAIILTSPIPGDTVKWKFMSPTCRSSGMYFKTNTDQGEY